MQTVLPQEAEVFQHLLDAPEDVLSVYLGAGAYPSYHRVRVCRRANTERQVTICNHLQ